jgi:predicted neuraminidase
MGRINKTLFLLTVIFPLFVEASSACPIHHPAVKSCEFIFEAAPFASSHASTIVETKRGLVAAWFGGSREGAADVAIWSARNENGTWSRPTTLARGLQNGGGQLPTWNPVLFRSRSGLLMLFYKVGPDPKSWWGMVMTSMDEGLSWSAPRRLPDGILGPTKNKPVQLSDGVILAPSSTEDHGWHVDIASSVNDGATWRSTGSLNPDDLLVIQPTLLAYSDQSIQMLVRNRQREAGEPQRIMQSRSYDRGRTWAPLTATALPNPNSGIDAVSLHDGTALLAFNDTPAGRSPLSVARSTDQGKNWTKILELENETGQEFSYPSIIEDSNGFVQVTYTWKRQKIRHVTIDPHAL